MTTVTIKVSLSHLIRMLIEKSIASADGFKPAVLYSPAFRYSLLCI